MFSGVECKSGDLQQFTLLQMNLARELSRRLRDANERLFESRVNPEARMQEPGYPEFSPSYDGPIAEAQETSRSARHRVLPTKSRRLPFLGRLASLAQMEKCDMKDDHHIF